MFNYKPTSTGLALHNSSKYVKMCVGPFASGKSCMMAMEVFMNAARQKAAPDGVRYSRVGVVRSSYPELGSATRRSLLEVLPPECGGIHSAGSPMAGVYKIPLPDGTSIQLELELWAIQSVDDCQKLRSCNWTSCWINEATGCVAEVFNAVTSRIGRFPSASLGGVTWGGILMDMNYPQTGTWLHDFIQNPQENWEVFMQPPAALKLEDVQGNVYYEINPEAENLENLGSDEAGDTPDFSPKQRGMRFYKNQVESLLRTGREDMVQNLYCLMDVPLIEGKVVYPNFRKDRHVSTRELTPVEFEPIILAMDQSGIHPAAVVLQQQEDKWCVLDELYMDGEGFENFLVAGIVPLLRRKYATNPVYCVIDPSNQRDSWQGITPKERLGEYGLQAVTEISNSPKVRIQAVDHMLNLYSGGLLIDPSCEMLIRGFESEYRYRRLRAAGSVGAVYTPQPDKNEYSHLQDAIGYSCLFILKGLQEDTVSDYSAVSEAVIRHRQKLMRVV